MNKNKLLVGLLLIAGLGQLLSCSSPGSRSPLELQSAGRDTTLDAGYATHATNSAAPASTSQSNDVPATTDGSAAVNGSGSAPGTGAKESVDGGTAINNEEPPHAGTDPSAAPAESSSSPPQSETISGENSQIVIPPGAAEEDLTITIEPGTNIASDAEWTYHAAGDPVRFGPSGTVFSKPVKVTLAYSPDVVGERPDLMVVAHRDDLTQLVTFIHPDSITAGNVNVFASSFSTFQPVLFTELMSGVVRDRNTNTPIAGAKVFFYGSGYGNAITDANGVYSFTIETLSSFGGALAGTLYIGADGYFEAPPLAVTDLGAQASLPVVNDVTLLPSAPLLTGIVTDASNGSPLAGATVSFSRTPMSTFRGGVTTLAVQTAFDGSYAVDASNFAENASGDFSVNLMLNVPGFLGTSESVNFHTGPVTRDFALNSSSGDLMRGVVRDRNTNAPIVGATVFFYGSGYGNATTDANGEYAFTMATLSSFGGALSGTLYIGAEGYFEAPPVSVTDLAAQPSLPVVNDVTLLASAPLVTGVVTDSSNGSPLSGATISFNRSPMSTFRGGVTTVSVQTALDGSYAIDASNFAENASGDFTVSLMVNVPSFLGVTQAANFHTGPITRDFALNSSTGTLMAGVVRDRTSNAPIAGAKVFFYGSGYGSATSDANGAYAFTAGMLTSFGGGLSGTLYVGADGYFEAPSVSVTDLGTQASLPVVNDVTLLGSAPLVTGIVTDSSNGSPLAGVNISFNRSPMSTFRGGATTVSVLSAPDGSYSIDASNFAESSSGDFSVNLMANLPGFLGASRARSFNPGPVVENLQLTPGTSQ